MYVYNDIVGNDMMMILVVNSIPMSACSLKNSSNSTNLSLWVKIQDDSQNKMQQIAGR